MRVVGVSIDPWLETNAVMSTATAIAANPEVAVAVGIVGAIGSWFLVRSIRHLIKRLDDLIVSIAKLAKHLEGILRPNGDATNHSNEIRRKSSRRRWGKWLLRGLLALAIAGLIVAWRSGTAPN